MNARSPALFLDRDGVINEEVGYLFRQEDVRWVEGIVPLCLAAQEHGYKVVVVTNQSGIARGYYSVSDFQALMAWMKGELARQGAFIDAVYYCPYHPEHGTGEYRREHEDRKPGPGMLLRAARELDLDLERSILVGDRCSDISAANAAGCAKAFLLSGTELSPCTGVYTLINSLAAVESWLATSCK